MKKIKSIMSVFIISSFLIPNFMYSSFADNSVLEKVLDQKCTTDHFNIIYSQKDEKIIHKVITDIENNYNSVTSHLKCELDDKVEVKLYSDVNQFHRAINWLDAPSWINGRAKDGIIEVLIRDSDVQRAVTLITHELTHIVTRKINSGFIPLVIFEGIATYEANQDYLKDDLNSLNSLPTLEELFSSVHCKSLYSLAYSFIEFLVENKGYEKVIELIKIKYEKNEFSFENIKEDYNKWVNSLKL